jgi:hypothetical protein
MKKDNFVDEKSLNFLCIWSNFVDEKGQTV